MGLSNKRMGVLLSVLGAGTAGCFLTGCGLQPHPTVASASGGATTVGAGTGGEIATSGGANGSGGAIQGSGGATMGGGSGGNASTGSGGQSSTGTGGSSTGSGGTATGSGGRSTGSGGASPGTGGSTGTGGANTTVGVTINGKFVPKEKAVAFIHFGHSNMRGYAVDPTSLRSYYYNTVDGLWSYKGSFTAAKEPTAPEGAMTQTQAGPGMAILQSALAARKASDVQFISIGFGSGSATTVDYAKSGSFYPVFMNWANQLKGKVTFGGIVIMLGITDGEHLPTAQVPAFPQRVAQIVSDIRADLGEPNLPVLFCDYEAMATGDLAPTAAVGKTMIPLIKMLPTMVSKLVLVPTDGLAMQDNHHFNLQGHKDWSNRVVMLMQSNSWFPW